MPPMYWSTGSQSSITALSSGFSSRGVVKRAKYQDESTNVSIVSVSRLAGAPQDGQGTSRQVG